MSDQIMPEVEVVEKSLMQTKTSFIAPTVTVAQAIERYKMLREFVVGTLVDGQDYGMVTGVKKPTLLKPGAEKLATFFSLRPTFTPLNEVMDWTGEHHGGEPFFFYRYKAQLWRAGELIAEGIGSCNSMEKKYRYRWVPEYDVPSYLDIEKLKTEDGTLFEFQFAIDKRETEGQYGKPVEYWQRFLSEIAAGTARPKERQTKRGMLPGWEIGGKLYAIPNTEIPDLVNTFDKMAQKRAFVASVLIGANASDYFTQDLEDLKTPPSNTPEDGEANAINPAQRDQEDAQQSYAPQGGLKPKNQGTEKEMNYLNAEVVKALKEIVGGSNNTETVKIIMGLKDANKIPHNATLNKFIELAKKATGKKESTPLEPLPDFVPNTTDSD